MKSPKKLRMFKLGEKTSEHLNQFNDDLKNLKTKNLQDLLENRKMMSKNQQPTDLAKKNKIRDFHSKQDRLNRSFLKRFSNYQKSKKRLELCLDDRQSYQKSPQRYRRKMNIKTTKHSVNQKIDLSKNIQGLTPVYSKKITLASPPAPKKLYYREKDNRKNHITVKHIKLSHDKPFTFVFSPQKKKKESSEPNSGKKDKGVLGNYRLFHSYNDYKRSNLQLLENLNQTMRRPEEVARGPDQNAADYYKKKRDYYRKTKRIQRNQSLNVRSKNLNGSDYNLLGMLESSLSPKKLNEFTREKKLGKVRKKNSKSIRHLNPKVSGPRIEEGVQQMKKSQSFRL